MRKSVLLLAVAMLTSPTSAQVRIPPGYELIQITNTPYPERQPALNNRGQIVFEGRMAGWDGTELFLYDTDGSLTRLTDDSVWDGTPDIADDGTIVWSKTIGDGDTDEIMVRSPSGEVTRLTFDDLDDHAPYINNLGQIAWNRLARTGCANASGNVMFFDGRTIQQLSDNLWSNQTTELNDDAEIVWTEYDFCPGAGNWISLIKLYANGTITTLSEANLQSQIPGINNNTVCAWSDADPVTFADRIHVWENRSAAYFTEGINPRLNDRGDMYFLRWNESNFTWQGWLYLKGEIRQLTDDPFWNTDGYINNRGEVAWLSGTWPDNDVRFLRRLPAGDLNCDGRLDGADIDPFFHALGDPSGYRLAHPNCDWTLADVNGDGRVNGADIDPFFEALGA